MTISPALFDHRHHFGQGRDVAAREDIFADPGIGGARPVGAADRVQQHDAVIGQQLARLGEELRVIARAHMLEHADRDDAVERSGQRRDSPRARIWQRSARPFCRASSCAAANCSVESVMPSTLAPRSRAISIASPPQPQPISSTLRPGRSKLSLAAMWRFFSRLGDFQRVAVVGEIGAGILPAHVQEQVIEAA